MIVDGSTFKQNSDHVENVSPAVDAIPGFDETEEPGLQEEEKRLVRKIDWIILPCLAVCYVFFYVSREPFYVHETL